MALFKCKMCGGTLEIKNNETVATCEYCGTQQTLPKTQDEVISNLFNRANNLRLKCEFDKASQIYEKIVEQDDSEAEAHWGIVLCKYGIEYVEDPKTLKRIPTCHRTLFEAVTTDTDYLAAVDYSDTLQQAIYEKEAKEIDKIQKDILNIVKNEKPFDVFICYKETDESGRRTVDSTIANDIYYQLTQEGFKVFYAAITLEDKLGQEYEPYIFAALNSAKVMLVLGTKPEYFNAIWVKNEWSRFLNIMKTDRSKLIIPCYREMDAYDLPEEFAHLQAQDMGKIGFINDIVRGIKKVATKEEKQTVVKEMVVASENKNVETLLKRVFLSLEDSDWKKAEDFCEQILNLDPENALVYVGKLMIELKVKTQESLKNVEKTFKKNNNYQKALRFADDELKETLKSYIDYIENARLERIYQNALNMMRVAKSVHNFKNVAKVFSSILEYKDAKELQKQCYEKAKIKRKHNQTVFGISSAVLALIVVIMFLINNVFIPIDKYNNAIELMNEEKYAEAITIFETLDGYKDSTKKLNECTILNYKKEFWKQVEENSLMFGSYDAKEIEWQILEIEEDKIFVISKYPVAFKRYDEHKTNNRTAWNYCTLRDWLNDDFINSAFSETEKAMILDTNCLAYNNPEYGTNPGNPTKDQVFLLSIDEANKYFNSNDARQCKNTINSTVNCRWWLRTPGIQQNYIAYVNSEGEIWGRGYLFSELYAVRPAMWIDLSQMK